MAEPPDLSGLHSYAPRSPAPYTSFQDSSSYSFSQQQPSYFNPPQQYQPQSPTHRPHDPYSYPQSSYDLPPPAPQHPQQQRPQRGASIKHEGIPPWLPGGTATAPSPSHPRGPKQTSVKQEPVQRLPAPGEAEGIVVKTKFPVARIKRIVQADEDVGKVAQVTPVVVSKALELFMISLTLRAAAIARTRGSKRLTASHLKQAVDTDEQFDFLSEIVARIPDAPASKEQHGMPPGKVETKKQESEDEEWDSKEDGKTKRRGRGSGAGGSGGGGRKRRAKASDD